MLEFSTLFPSHKMLWLVGIATTLLFLNIIVGRTRLALWFGLIGAILAALDVALFTIAIWLTADSHTKPGFNLVQFRLWLTVGAFCIIALLLSCKLAKRRRW